MNDAKSVFLQENRFMNVLLQNGIHLVFTSVDLQGSADSVDTMTKSSYHM